MIMGLIRTIKKYAVILIILIIITPTAAGAIVLKLGQDAHTFQHSAHLHTPGNPLHVHISANHHHHKKH